MNLRYEESPPKTIDEVCGKPAGTFAKFLKARERQERMHEARTQRRITEAHEKRKANVLISHAQATKTTATAATFGRDA